MAAPKKTPLERPDSDLTTPVHDEIMIWLTGTLSKMPVVPISYLVEEKYKTTEYYSRTDYRNIKIESEDRFIEHCAARGYGHEDWTELVKRKAEEVQHKLVWELPVPGKAGTIGFIDLYAQTVGLRAGLFYNDHGMSECKQENCLHTECWEISLSTVILKHYAFEVKSSIPSIGELIRQVRRYEAALPWCHCPYRYGQKEHYNGPGEGEHFRPDFMVVSPDTRGMESIVQQGIGFIEYPSGVVKRA